MYMYIFLRIEIMRTDRSRLGDSVRRHQTCHFRRHTTSAPAELGGETHDVSRNRARAQVLPQAQKLHVYGSGALAAFEAVHMGILLQFRQLYFQKNP